jgi:hypothetical protein
LSVEEVKVGDVSSWSSELKRLTNDEEEEEEENGKGEEKNLVWFVAACPRGESFS